jgi:hypothetical protein
MAAASSTFLGPPARTSSNAVFGFVAVFPPNPRTATASASTWACSASPMRLARSATLRSFTTPERTTWS